MEIKRLLTTAAIAAILPAGMHGQQADRDTLSANGNSQEHYTFCWKKTALPVSLMGAGAIALAPSFIRHSSRTVTRDIIDLRGNSSRLEFDDDIQYLPVAGALLLGSTGIKARHPFLDRAVIVATSYAVLAVLTNIPKLCIDEKRPEFAGRNSFPSGHTATAFMGAELVRIEYGGWYGLGAYAIATGVGFMRMYNGRHWLHDVVAGAGVGILSARAGEWSCRLWRKAFQKRRKRDDALVFMPVATPVGNGYYGFIMEYGF